MAKRRQWVWWVATLGVLAALLAAGWSARHRFLPMDVGTRAPDFQAVDLQGRAVSLSSLRGQVVLVNIWATWCGPCRDEMPSMERLHRELGPRGLKIVAVSVDKAPTGAKELQAFGRELGLTFTVWHDASGRIQQTYRTTGVPESFLVGRDGVIVRKVIGATEWDHPAQADLVRRLLAEGPA
ncbi:MAG TPA: TlpA disulfide reductase family protein [Longimicrobium sp.]|jgi:peroxiredoxin|uniref:peroxiredoxin family protein n=1 Tax=Longimicrobium sp. TaxID=2029185 RepID=UPI002ED7D3C1